MKREASERLDVWLKASDRKPLVLIGARQTGKTWIVRDLAAKNNKRLVEINFERTPEFASYFASRDPVKILQQLGAECGRDIVPGESLLFLDEIQAAVQVFPMLRWFKEGMPELPVIAAGSLLDFALADHTFSMPVGRISYFYLEPMSFLEFVLASGNEQLYSALAAVSPDAPLNDLLHEKCLGLYGQYCLCGGMPEVVNKWISTQSMNECLAVQTDLLATFQDDFNKYGADSHIIRKTFRSVADQLGSKFVLSRVDDGSRVADVKKAVALLSMSRTVSRVQYSAGNGIPPGAEMNEKFFKLLFVDTGLVCAQLGLARTGNVESKAMMLINSGQLAEQFVGQQLRYAFAAMGNTELYYWQRTGGRQGEIDYLIQSGNRIVPVEVKSGSSGSMKSLHQFMFDKKLKFAVRCDTNNLSRQKLNVKTTQGDVVCYSLLSVPVYLAEKIPELAAKSQD